MSFEIKQAARSAVKPLVGFYGKSGSGKTMSALLFARGIVGPKGRITVLDTENRRAELFADLIPGGYSVIPFDAPFSPERYLEAFTLAESQSDCVLIDSFSHCWEGEGGVLDMQEAELDRMAGDNYAKRDKCKMAAWIKPKMGHKKLVGRLLRSKVALICCLRGQEKTHTKKGDDGKQIVYTDEFSTPIADPRFIFELLLNFETVNVDGQGGYVYPVKITHPAIAPLLPQAGKQQIGVEHGAALAKWCAAPSASGPSVQASADSSATFKGDPRSPLLKELRDLTSDIHGWKPGMTATDWQALKPRLEQHLWDEDYIRQDEQLDGLSADRLREVLTRLKARQS